MMKKFHDLVKRLVVAGVVVVIVGAIVFFSQRPLMNFVLALFIATFGGIVSWEYVQLTKEKRLEKVCVGATILAILSLGFVPKLTPLVLFAAAVLLFVLHFRKIEGSIREIGAAFLGILYVAFPIGLVLPILYYGDGRMWLLYLVAVTKGTDICAYFGGILFGKQKLAPVLSPAKSWEGAYVGFFGGIAISCAFIPLLTVPEAIVLGAILSILGQVGDLAGSLLKRDAQVKDSNRLPGLGGLLDLVDSLLFTIPLLYFFLYL